VTAAFLEANKRTWSSLRKYRNYRLFFTGQVISTVGTWMHNIAAAWLVLSLTHSAFAVGVLAVFQFLPFTLFGLFAGVLVDRFDARRLVIATQAASLVFAATLATLTLAGHIGVSAVYALTALRGSILVLDAPARQALTFQMVGRADLPNAVALNSSLFNAARVIGPAIGGGLVALAGAGACFAVNAVSFLAVLAALLLMRRQEMFPVERAADRPTLFRGTLEAFAYVRGTRSAWIALLIVVVVANLSFNFNVLLPVLAQELGGGAAVFGVISAFFGAGALAGALVSATRGRATWSVLLAGTAAFGAAQLVLAPMASVAAVSALLFCAGMSFTTWTSNANSLLQLSAPDHLRGRVVGLYFFAFNGFGPAGGLLSGWLAQHGGTGVAFAFSGAAAVATAAWAAWLVKGGIPQLPAGPFRREGRWPAGRGRRVSPPAPGAAGQRLAARSGARSGSRS
jgi:MFS family permease